MGGKSIIGVVTCHNLLTVLLLARAGQVQSARAAGADGPKEGTTVISNVEPRRDSDGNILNAHDGALYSFSPGQYLLIGTSYAECESFTNCSSHIGDCGWQDNNFSAYSSSDLQTWKLESSDMVPVRPRGGANFRPKILRNTAGTYVMWYNFQPPTPNIPGYYTVATSQTATGPYSILHEQVNVSMPLNGDFNLFVDEDDDRAGYIVYNSDKNGHLCGACHIPPCDCGFQMSVEKLSADYTTSSMKNSGWIGAPTVEAPAMFKREGIYYLLFDRLSCFGPQGSGAVVYTSRKPMGPYIAQGNINRNGITGPFRESQLSFIIIPAQQTFVAQVGDTFIWQGDLWNSYTDGDGRNVKAWDYQTWVPLDFLPDGNLSKLVWKDEWSLQLPKRM